MGAWSEDAFGNDAACDWSGEFLDNPGLEKVKQAIDIDLMSEDYLEYDDACAALVACEIIARLKGNWGKKSAYSEAIDNWVETSDIVPDKQLTNKAVDTIARIVGENSELRELWDEDGENVKWHFEMDNLLVRIND
ncbi:hypothetical protein BTJ40_05215 [Microbulbifer sp. A4B17]|uniref:DUF4259 domain-containing protein n=1 Tax=Microbulbifer sp. A4B17 TaxID=359370 RepID=UPI000D52ECEB|nr:DUF4259 domain-containing protein [Microbulbifer sp. A4B17]AWF80258.1 hypothetical protein BTJ40_05215 [Microbulbifer sp. A4B17]